MSASLALAPPAGAGGASPDRRHFLVEGVRCGACVARIERDLMGLPGVAAARLNLTTRRLVVTGRNLDAEAIRARLDGLGYPAAAYEPERLAEGDDREERALLKALAVAGFAAGNVMLLSVGVWAGNGYGMGEATRALLHWVSALIALPALVVAGRPFFASALGALRAGRTNMDVPIAVGVLLTGGMSLFETARGGAHVYFDSAVALLFFLLIGRYLERRARGRARAAASRLVALMGRAVTLVLPDGTLRRVAADGVRRGDRVLVAAGERVPVDGEVASGTSDLDTALITGESVPRPAGIGTPVHAGTLNLSGPIEVGVRHVGEGTLLAEIVRLMEAAEGRRARFVGLAERVSRLYAPVVHTLALATFLLWWPVLGAPWQTALLHGVAVLIVTCPCALGLAVPVVQVIASGRLFRDGTFLKSATALERLREVDAVVFDKTGTLTLGDLRLLPDPARDPADLELAASLAAASRHPLAVALHAARPDARPCAGVEERPGRGLALKTAEGEVRLGSRAFVGVPDDGADGGLGGAELWLARLGAAPCRFAFADRLRPDAAAVVAWLRARGIAVGLLSGDRPATVAAAARALGIEDAVAGLDPAGKTARLEALAAAGRKVLMVGDGLNDAPALAAAHVSLSPSSAADVSRTAADAVFQSDSLRPVVDLIATARGADRLVRQNIGLSLGYNLLAVPLAVGGFVTPLLAAILMSGSSLVVIGNALRLSRRRPEALPAPPAAPPPA